MGSIQREFKKCLGSGTPMHFAGPQLSIKSKNKPFRCLIDLLQKCIILENSDIGLFHVKNNAKNQALPRTSLYALTKPSFFLEHEPAQQSFYKNKNRSDDTLFVPSPAA